jgi:mono/diheme cytochrome c family protein
MLLTVLAVQVLWAWPWSRDMVLQIFLRPQQQPFTPPVGSIAVGREAPLTRPAAERQLRNPLLANEETREQGRQLYATYCLVCHGPQGRGDGPVAGGAMVPADVTGERIQNQSDGALYHTLRHGLGTMPAYYDRLTPQERWLIVHYVRSLGSQQER